MDDGKLGFNISNTLYANATHPGGVATDQQQQAVEAYGTLGKIGVKAVMPMLSDPVKQGCRSALFATTADEVIEKGISGAYIVPDKKVTDPSKQAQDVELQESLWRLSLEILKEKLGGLEYKVEVV